MGWPAFVQRLWSRKAANLPPAPPAPRSGQTGASGAFGGSANSQSGEQSASAPGGQFDVRQIVPLIKPRQWLRQQQQADRNWLASHVVEDFNDELVVLYAEDRAERLRYLTRAALKQQNVALPQLRALALENLMRLLPGVSLHKGPLVSMLTAGGCYEASLLLVSDFWASHGVLAPGELIVAAPSRDVVLLASSANPAAIAHLRDLADTSWQQSGHAVSRSLFVFRQGRFQVWSDSQGSQGSQGS